MWEGLLTWNWQLWYKLNALLGVAMLTMGFLISYENLLLAGMFYMLIYALLWIVSILNNNEV